MTPALSPSRAADFKQCPLLYRFRVVDATVALIPGAWESLVEAEPALAALITEDESMSPGAWVADADALVRRWFTLEDPTRLAPADRELMIEVDVDGLTLRGIVDRLDVAPNGAMRVVDYKTGRSPREAFEGKALFQMKFYALVLWRLRGEVPKVLQLVYLGNGEVVRYVPDEHDLLAVERNVKAVWNAIALAAETGDWRPRTSRLCDWCDFKSLCPAWGGTPPPLPGAAASRLKGEAWRRLTSEVRASARSPWRVSSWTTPGIGGTGTVCGIHSVGTPAVTADCTPVAESSIARQRLGSTPRAAAAAR